MSISVGNAGTDKVKIEGIVKAIKPVDTAYYARAQARLDNLTKPKGSLGRLEEIAMRIVAISKNLKPSMKRKVIFTMAGDHGVCEEGVSAYPQEVTPQMVYNFLRGGAGINVLAKHVGAEVIVVDMGVKEKIKTQKSKLKNFKDKKVAFGTKNFAREPAMTREEAVKSVMGGIEVFQEAINPSTTTGTFFDAAANTTPEIPPISNPPTLDKTSIGSFGFGL